MKRIPRFIASAGLLAAAAAVLLGVRLISGPAHKGQLIELAEKPDALRDDFNDSRDALRLLAIVSPT